MTQLMLILSTVIWESHTKEELETNPQLENGDERQALAASTVVRHTAEWAKKFSIRRARTRMGASWSSQPE